jgi:hypothetical protein
MADSDFRSVIGDATNQAALISSFERLTTRLAILADQVEVQQQAVRIIDYEFVPLKG